MTAFGKALMKAMRDRQMTQKQLSVVIGASPASVSLWLSGQTTPKTERQTEIAVRLGLEPDYFRKGPEADPAEDDGIRTISVETAARLLHVDKTTVRKGLQQGVFPWGYAIRTSDTRWRYIINADKFNKTEVVP